MDIGVLDIIAASAISFMCGIGICGLIAIVISALIIDKKIKTKIATEYNELQELKDKVKQLEEANK